MSLYLQGPNEPRIRKFRVSGQNWSDRVQGGRRGRQRVVDGKRRAQHHRGRSGKLSFCFSFYEFGKKNRILEIDVALKRFTPKNF